MDFVTGVEGACLDVDFDAISFVNFISSFVVEPASFRLLFSLFFFCWAVACFEGFDGAIMSSSSKSSNNPDILSSLLFRCWSERAALMAVNSAEVAGFPSNASV